MTRTEKEELIASFESGYSRIQELVAGIGPDELRFAPPVQDAWSVNDFLVHFLDADLSLAFRIRTAIAEPGKAVPVWEEEDWHDALHYEKEDGLSCLALAKGIRSFVCVGLRSVADADWSAFFVMHPARGRLELPALLQMYTEHLVFHAPLIRRNRQAWLKRAL
jgi:hypothetical protein